MSWLSSVRIALRSVQVNLLRSLLTILGVVIGVAAVIAMIAIGSGAQRQLDEQISALGTNVIVTMPGSRTVRGVRLGAGSSGSITEDDAFALQRELGDVQAAAPILRGTG